MNEITLNFNNLLNESYSRHARDALNTRGNQLKSLIQQKKLPHDGWDDFSIEMVLQQISAMDSNNFVNSVGVGEREGRFASELVARRHYRFCHGIGRSGDLLEAQPKAAGSTLINKLTNVLLADLMKELGIRSPLECILVPVATGMSLVISLLTIRQIKPDAKYVIWPRIDQKSCFKSIISAGYIPVTIENLKEGDALTTNISEVEAKILELGVENVACIISTSSCFAPRVCDNLEFLAKIAKKYNIYHFINNAYGMQCTYYMERIQKAKKDGRVDLFVQSTDKNLLVPVGGAIIACFNIDLASKIAKMYPGRASFTPTLDVFITLLSLGRNGNFKLLENRNHMYEYLHKSLQDFAQSVQEKVLLTDSNKISIGITLSNLEEDQLTKLGSMLFTRHVTGARVVTCKDVKDIMGYKFEGFGAHFKNYPVPYLTAAAAIGMKKEDVDIFINKLSDCYRKLLNKTA